MRLNNSELRNLIARTTEAECPPIVRLNGADYRLVAVYNDPTNPAVVGLKVNDNRAALPHLTLMVNNRFGVPTLSQKPSTVHRLTIDDIADMVAQGPAGKAGYCQTTWRLLQSVWNHGLQPTTLELQMFIRQTVNSGAVMDVYDGGMCFQSTWWTCWPSTDTAIERIAPVIVSHLVARDEAAKSKFIAELDANAIIANVLTLTQPVTALPVAA